MPNFDFFDPDLSDDEAVSVGLRQFGVQLPPGTARMTPGQGQKTGTGISVSVEPRRRSDNLDDLSWEELVEIENRMDQRDQDLVTYGTAAGRFYLDDVSRESIETLLDWKFGKGMGRRLYKAVEQEWKPYKRMYRIAGEYARGERVDPGYVQSLDPKERKRFYAFMMWQASPEQRSALGKFGENFLRGAEDIHNAIEENLTKLWGWELSLRPAREVRYSTPDAERALTAMREGKLGPPGEMLAEIADKYPVPVLKASEKPATMQVEAAVAEAAEIRRRIRRIREAGDPVESEGILGQGFLDVARMGPRLIGGAAASYAGPAGAVAWWTSQIAPDLEDEMKDMGVDPNKAAVMSLLAAVPSAIVEAAQVKQLTPGANEAVKRGALAFITAYAKRMPKTWAKEVGEEGLQYLIEEAGKNAALYASKEDPDVDWNDIIIRGVEEMKRSGVALALLTAGGHVPGAVRGLNVAIAKQRIHDAALLVAEKADNIKMRQYGDTVARMMDEGTQVDEKSEGLVKRVMEEAESIKMKDAISVVSEARQEERAKQAKQAKREEPGKQAVAEPQKPVEKPKPKPEPKAKEPKKVAPAKPGPKPAPAMELSRPKKPKPEPTRAEIEAEYREENPDLSEAEIQREVEAELENRRALAKLDAAVDAVTANLPKGTTSGANIARVIYDEFGVHAPARGDYGRDAQLVRIGMSRTAPAKIANLSSKEFKAKLAAAIAKASAESKGLDLGGLMGPMSGLTDAGKAAWLRDVASKAERAVSELQESMAERVAEAGTERVLPPAPAPAETSEFTEKKAKRISRAKSGLGIRQLAQEVDRALLAGKIEADEGVYLYTQLGLKVVDLEKTEVKAPMPQVKEALRKRIRALTGAAEATPAPKPESVTEPTVPVERGESRLYHAGSLSGTGDFIHVGTRAAADFVSERTGQPVQETARIPQNPARMIDTGEAHDPARIAEGLYQANKGDAAHDWETMRDIVRNTQRRQSVEEAYTTLKTILARWGFDGIAYENVNEDPGSTSYILLTGKEGFVPAMAAGPRMGEEVLKKPEPPPPSRPSTQYTRLDAIEQLELGDKDATELAEEMRERGLKPGKMGEEEMRSAIVHDAVVAGEIPPITEGRAPEVTRAAPAAQAAPPATELAPGGVITQNETRALQDMILNRMREVRKQHGKKAAGTVDFEEKHLQEPVEATIRKAFESGNYAQAADRLRTAIKKFNRHYGTRSGPRRAFRQEFVPALQAAADELARLGRNEVPESIAAKRQQAAETGARMAATDAAVNEARRRSPEMDAYLTAREATEDAGADVAFERGKDGGAPEVSLPTEKQARAQLALEKREAEAVEKGTLPELIADQILDMDDPAAVRETLRDLDAETLKAVTEIVQGRKTKTGRARDATAELGGEDQTAFSAGMPYAAFRAALDRVGAVWERLSTKLIKAHKLRKAKFRVAEAMRQAFGSLGYSQELALKKIREMFITDRISPDDAELITHWREDPDNNPLPERLKDVGEAVDAFYEIIEGMWKQMGMGTWPASAIKRNAGKIAELQEHLGDLKEGSKARDAALQEIDDLEAANEYLATLRYQHHMVLKKPIRADQGIMLEDVLRRPGNREKFRTTPRELLGRKFPTVRSLQEAGYDVETDFRVSMAKAFAYVQHKLMVHDFHETYIKSDPDLALPAEEAPLGWVALPDIEPFNRRRYKVGTEKVRVIGANGKTKTEKRTRYAYKGEKWKVNPIVAQAIRDFTERASESTGFGEFYDHVNSMMKQLKFYNPLIMTVNNLWQGFAAAGHSSFRHFGSALKSVLSRDEDYMAMVRADLFSTPSDLGFEEFSDLLRDEIRAHYESKSPIGQWLRKTSGIHKWQDLWKILPVHRNSAPYKMARQATWWMDRVARVATVQALMKQRQKSHRIASKGAIPFNRERALLESVVKAREFHADYNLMRAEPGKWSRRMLLTPAYKGAMWLRLFPRMTRDTVRGLYELAARKPITGDTMPMARVLGAIVGMNAAMALLGYSWEDWYRFVKEDEDEEGETVVQMFGPFSEPFKVIGRWTSGYEEGRAADVRSAYQKGFSRVVYNNLAAIPKTVVSLYRNRDWKGDVIITRGAGEDAQALELAGFLIKETLPYMSQAESWGDKEQTAIARLVGLAAITMYHRDSTKRTWFKHKMIQKQKDVRAWAKDAAKGDPTLSRQYNEIAGRRFAAYAIALSATLKEYEDRVETAKKGNAWVRLMNQFDRYAWVHAKIEEDSPTLLSEKKLAELNALLKSPPTYRGGESKAEFIERVMRRKFAATFLKETMGHGR